jgi:uncharacterized protein YggU (UPF0235/DUF167 family)
VLNVPKSDVRVIKGLKSRDKVITVADIDGDGEEFISKIRDILKSAV